MKVKTTDLTGPALDWAVAKCEGFEPAITTVAEQAENFRTIVHCDGSKPPQEAIDAVISGLKPRIYRNADKLTPIPKYSADWAQGGLIIEREQIATKFWQSEQSWIADVKGGFFEQYGATALIAAMRCYVASKLGDEIEIPEELASAT